MNTIIFLEITELWRSIKSNYQVSDWNGSQLDLGADQVERRALFPSGGVLVTNSNVHNQILEMISSGSSAV